MKLIVTTVYDGIDKAWVKWYADELAKHADLKKAKIAESLLDTGEAGYSSESPEPPYENATTTYRVIV